MFNKFCIVEEGTNKRQILTILEKIGDLVIMKKILSLSAYGDAIGAPYEFNDYVLKEGEEPQFLPYGKGLPKHPVGEWTDDTYMAYCISAALLDEVEQQDFVISRYLDNVAKNFLQWANEHPAGIGIQTSILLNDVSYAYGAGKQPAKQMKKLSERNFKAEPTKSAGNGSLMRIHPVSLLNISKESRAKIAAETTALTHMDPRCQTASVLWVEMLRYAIEHDDLELRVGLPLIQKKAQQYWFEKIGEAEINESRIFAQRGWWVVPSFQQAYGVVFENKDAVDNNNPMKVFTDVAFEKLSDADTINAISGGLMGALGNDFQNLPEKDVVHGLWPQFMKLDSLDKMQETIMNASWRKIKS